MDWPRQQGIQDRRRREPSLYDDYLNQERAAQHGATSNRNAEPNSEEHITIRTVSPDAHAEDVVVQPRSTRKFERMFLSGSSPGASPRSKKQDRDSHSDGHKRLPPRSQSIDVGNSGEHAMNDFQPGYSISRTRTLDDPKMFEDLAESQKSRPRVGSVQHSNSSPIHNAQAHDRSANLSTPEFHSTPSPASLATTSVHRAVNQRKRQEWSESTLASQSDITSDSFSSPTAQRILQLMKTLCGRMSGNVCYRRKIENPWTSSYCYIEEDTGNLIGEALSANSSTKTLVHDLRGCQVKVARDQDAKLPCLEILAADSSLELYLRFTSQSDFQSWFAALLCWQSVHLRGTHSRTSKSQAAGTPVHRIAMDGRRDSETSVLKEAPVIKVGRMVYWDSNTPHSNTATPLSKSTKQQPRKTQSHGSRWWRGISCTLRENGELKLFTESENALVSVVQLSQLSRSAIQRLDPSVFGTDFCISIYPRYTSDFGATSATRPIHLSLESRILFEVWFVLLRAFTIPQLYGPPQSTAYDNDDMASSPKSDGDLAMPKGGMFRMERALSLRVVEAKILAHVTKFTSEGHSSRPNHSQKPTLGAGYYVDVQLDGETRANTQVRPSGSAPIWGESFDFVDLPAVLSSASVFLMHRSPDTATPREQHESRHIHEAYGLVNGAHSANVSSGYTGVSHDGMLGKVEISLDELEPSKEVEKRWPVVDAHDEIIGQILISTRAEECVVLMAHDYEPLRRLLHNFESGLTLQIAHMIPLGLKRLSDYLLNIFQVSGQASDWLMALVEEEIDGIHKETPISRLRYTQRMGSNASEDASGQPNDRELIVRDMNKNATLEANLLFRGNTLLTKALDSHMRRVGGDYLLSTLGPVIKTLNDKDLDCEVDPNRVTGPNDMTNNWRRLTACMKEVWTAIESSAQKCPTGLRQIFRHIRACAEDRYGDYLRTVVYSSVTGFLFLRFFCPAVLNPKQFGLLKDDPKPRARRTFTLVAKSLQGLANMASFGSKEHWMEPMNSFLTTHRDAFKSFIDTICFVTGPTVLLSEVPASYSTPLAIRNRLPDTSREGFPSLPYLIDRPRELAGLVELWLRSAGVQGSGIAAQIVQEDGDLLTFHNLCTELHARTQECLSRAERAERPSSTTSFQWDELIERLQGAGLEKGVMFDDVDVSNKAGPLTEDPEVADDEPRSSGTNTTERSTAVREEKSQLHPATVAAAATLLTQRKRNPRSGFILPNTSTDPGSPTGIDMGRGSPSLDASTGKRASARSKRAAAPAKAAAAAPASPRLAPPVRPSSVNSGIGSDAEVTTALPSVSRERQRARRERWDQHLRDTAEEQERLSHEEHLRLEREREKAGLRVFVPGLGRRRQERERGEREKEEREKGEREKGERDVSRKKDGDLESRELEQTRG